MSCNSWSILNDQHKFPVPQFKKECIRYHVCLEAILADGYVCWKTVLQFSLLFFFSGDKSIWPETFALKSFSFRVPTMPFIFYLNFEFDVFVLLRIFSNEKLENRAYEKSLKRFWNNFYYPSKALPFNTCGLAKVCLK
jgi:hypothetical protein